MKKIKVILVMAIAILLDSTLLGEEQDALGYGLFPENIFNTGILTIILLLVLVGISGILYFRHQALKAMRQLNEQTAILQEQRITTLRSIGDGVIVTDKDLRITLINQVVTDLTGYSEEEVLGKVAGDVFKLENYDSHAPVEISLKAAIEQNKIYRSHNHTDLIGRDGQRNHIADSAAPIHDSRGRVIGGIMIIHDVTADYERRERLDAVLLKEQNLNGELHNSAIIHNILLENMPCLMVAKDINNDMRYVLCNRSFCKITGRDKTEVLGRVDAECFNNPAELAALSKFDQEAISQAAPTDHVFKITDCYGNLRWYHCHWVPLKLTDGRHWLFVFGEDVTEIENRRRESNSNAEYLRLTLNSIGDGVIATDEYGNITLMNPVAERMTGVKKELALGRPHEQVFKIVSAVDERPMASPVTRSLRTGNIVELANHTDLLGEHGKRYHIADSAAPILDDKRQIAGAILVFRDVTEEYLQRDQLRNALSGLEYAAKLSHAAYFRMGMRDRNMLSYSSEFPDLWPIRDGRAVDPEEFVFSEDWERNQHLFKDLMTGKLREVVMNYRRDKNGETKFYQIRAVLDDSERLNPVFVGVIQDITELTRKERQLADTLQLWDLVLGTIPVMIYAEDPDNDFRFTISNHAFEAFMRMNHEDVIGHNDYELLPDKELAEYFRRSDEAVLQKNEAIEISESIADCDGNIHHFKSMKIPLRAADGRRLLLGVSVDLTKEIDSRLALERLKTAQDDLLKQHEFILNAMPFSVFIQDAANEFRYIYCNKACAEVLGYSLSEVVGKNNCELLNCKKDVDLSLELCRKAMASNEMQESIQLLTDRHGQRHIGRAFRQSVTFSGERHCLLGMVVDVTETTELANNQAALNECFATMFNSGKSDTLSEIIGIMCRRLDAARGYLIKFDFVGGRFVPEAEYLGVAGELKPVNDQSFSINNNLYRVLTSDGIVMAPDVNDPEAIEKLGLWKTENERYGVRSLYCALVSANDAPWGYIAVTYENDCRQISEYEKNFLLSVARLGGLMIERRWAAEQQQLTIAELRNNKSLMEYGATLTKSGVFRYDLSEDSIVGSKGVEELFAIESGKALPPEKWVCPEDLTEIRRQLDNIYGGKTDQVTFNFRSNYFGERRNYRMLFSRDKNSKKNIFFGAIQDITEITLQSEKLRETMSLWNLVLDLIPVMIFAKRADDNFRYTLANKAFISFTGKPLEEIVGHCDAEIFDRPDDCEWFDECDRAVMVDNNSKSFVENVAGGGGIMHSIRTTKMPFTDANGRRLLLAACMDVTELNDLIANLNVLNSCLEIFFRSENSSEALLALLKNIAAHMKADYVYVLRLDLNQGLADTVMDYAVAPMEPFLHGLKSMPLDVNDLSVRYLKEHFECFLNNVRDPEQRKILHSWERFFGKYDMRSLYFSGIRQDGEIWGDLGVAYTGKPHQMSDLDRQFLRSTAHLIELLLERERSADKLRSALTQAQAAERAKSMFLASMSHEIRTPLNAVIGFSELLKEGTPTPREQQEYLDGIFSSGNALLELINDVLDLSKLEAGQMQLILEKVDFEALLNEMATIFKIKCAEQQIYIRLECVNKLPELWLDKLRLRQILFNLIGNAVKFTEHGGVNVVVDFSAVSESEGVLTFHVIDTGCGIPEAEQKQLFQIFVQASSARTNATSTGNGSGLGLAICRRLIEQMKGKIELHSQVGVGSDFTVMLPNVRFEAGVNKKKIQTVGRGKVSYCRDYHALIVDDVAMNLKVMGAMLKKLGVYTIAASGGVEALAALEREKIDFVLTDMWMPEMNGAELATQIRSQEKFANLPIYAVTADIEAQENFSVELFSGILLKPISIEKFQRLLNELA